MKLWPQKRWKQLLLVFFVFFLTVVVVLAIVSTYVSSAVNKGLYNSDAIVVLGGRNYVDIVKTVFTMNTLCGFPLFALVIFTNSLLVLS